MFYAKLANDPTFWLVENNERKSIPSPAEMLKCGIFRVQVLTKEELEAIPVAGSKRKPKEKAES